MNSTRPAGSRRSRGTSPLLLFFVLLAVAWLTSPAEGSLPRTGFQDANPAALAGAEVVDGGQRLAGIETPFSLITVEELQEALARNPAPEAGGLNLVESSLLEPPELTSRACEASFSLHLEPVDFGLNPQRGPPLEIPDLHQGWFVAEPKTRIGGFGLELENLIKGECPLSLGSRRGYEVEGWGIAEEERPDPWGLCGWWSDVPCLQELKNSALSLGGFLFEADQTGRRMNPLGNPVGFVTSQYQMGKALSAKYAQAYEQGGSTALGNAVIDDALGMVPGVNTYREGSKVQDTYLNQGAFEGGRQVFRTTFALETDILAVYGAARGIQARMAPEPVPSIVPEGGWQFPQKPPLSSSEIVRYDGEFAAKQILGDHTPAGNITPGGRTIMPHAAERMVNPPGGRTVMTKAEIDAVLDTGDRIRKISPHPEGTTVTVQHTGMPGKPEVVVDADTGKRVVTVVNPKVKP